MSNLQEKFRVLKCKTAVRSVIGNYVTCKRYSARKLDTTLGALPSEGVCDANIFEITGIGFAGPLFLRNSQKAWICIFTCAVFRAIHLEITTSLSTEGFLQVLHIFIARRERPSIVYTNNGKNFIGTYNLLRKLGWNKVKQFSTAQNINWRRTAAWWGGSGSV